MTLVLRQSTASQEVLLGPFVDDADGVTAMTGLTIANTDIKIFKTGATTLANKNSGGATHISNGNYYAVFDATDTDTIGAGRIVVQVAGALPFFRDFIVYDEAVYDVLFGTTAPSTLTAAAVNTEVDTALADIHLDHLIATAASIPAVTSGTYLDQIMDDGTASYDRTTDSLQAIRDRGDAAWVSDTTDIAAAVLDVPAASHNTAGTVGEAINQAAAGSALSESDIAIAVVDQTLSGHTTTGTVGEALSIAAVLPSAAAIADAVTDEALAGHTTPGTVGAQLTNVATSAELAALQDDVTLAMVKLGVFRLVRSGTTLTGYAEDEVTVAATWTLDDATNPTSIIRAS